MIALKFLRAGRRALFSETRWPDAGEGFLEAAPGALVACRNGLHACAVEDLAFWISDELWEVELGDERVRVPDAWLARRARLVRPIERWGHGGAARLSQVCIARASEQCARAGVPADHLAAQYLKEAKELAGAAMHAPATYAAALVTGALAPEPQAMAAYRAERQMQGNLLAEVVGL